MTTKLGYQVCMICLETTDNLKVLTSCKHAFCKICLSKHIESLGEAKESCPCPTCHVDCPLPQNNVDALMDYSHGDVGDERSPADLEIVECRCCRLTKNALVKAESFCQDCGKVYLCRDCTVSHGQNKANADHCVISVKKKTGRKCQQHSELVSSYCCTCLRPCCFLCVMLEHGDHDVKGIGEVFRSLVQEVKLVAEGHESRANNLQVAKKQLKILSSSEVSQRRDVLIQEIDDQAEKCHHQIAIQQSELKDKVQSDYKVVTEVHNLLEKAPTLVSQDVARSRTFITTAEPHPHDIEQLSVLKRGIVQSRVSDEIDVDSYWESYMKLLDNPIQFVPNGKEYNIGRLEGKRNAPSGIANCKLIFEKKFVVDDKRKYIPCVANLGKNFYAIAHLTTPGTQSKAIDIYKFPGDFQRTITDINRIYDMAATAEGHLAVLSDGVTENNCNVLLFDPESGYIKSTCDFSLRNPLSFDVNLRNQYVILNVGDDGQRDVSIVNAEGLIEFTQAIEQADASRIACCARDQYVVIGKTRLVVYEEKGKNLTQVTHFNWSSLQLTDVSATWSGEIDVGYMHDKMYHSMYKILRRFRRNKTLEDGGALEIYRVPTGVNAEARLSVRDGYIVTSHDHTIKVFK